MAKWLGRWQVREESADNLKPATCIGA